MKTQLLCTFTNTENYDETIKTIIGADEVIFNKIYVFTNKDKQQAFGFDDFTFKLWLRKVESCRIKR